MKNYRVKQESDLYYPQYATKRKQYYLFGKEITVWNNFEEFEFGSLDGLDSDRYRDVSFRSLEKARQYIRKQLNKPDIKIHSYE